MRQEEPETVSFSMFGENFSVKVSSKERRESLLQAVTAVQNKTSRLLRDNPTLSPQQTAILTAIDIQNSLQEFLGGSTPFQAQASTLIDKIHGVLIRRS
ncbi:MAG: cell division protein ZapA [Succinivibrio sp.]|nr:cell division protein ZapA [Succinivibrio sp.]